MRKSINGVVVRLCIKMILVKALSLQKHNAGFLFA